MINYYKIIDESETIICVGYGPIGDKEIVITKKEYEDIREQMILDFILEYGL